MNDISEFPAPAERELPADRRRLLKESMMQKIHQDLAESPRPLRSWLRRPVLLGATVAAAAAVAIAVPVVTGGGSPAYAVSKNPDGTIKIQIREFTDAGKLQADLRALGVEVMVDYIPPGKRCQKPRVENPAPREEARKVLLGPPPGPLEGVETLGEIAYTVDPSVIKPGQTAVLAFAEARPTSDGAMVSAIKAWINNGPVAPCVLEDSPDPGFADPE